MFTNCTRCNKKLRGANNKRTGYCSLHPPPKPRRPICVYEGCETTPLNQNDEYCFQHREETQKRYKENRARRKVKSFLRDMKTLESNPEQLLPQKIDTTLCRIRKPN